MRKLFRFLLGLAFGLFFLATIPVTLLIEKYDRPDLSVDDILNMK